MTVWRIFSGLFLFLIALCIHAAGAERVASHHLLLQLVSEQSTIAAGKEFSVAIHFALEPGWHLYWINPGDSGEPPRVEWELPKGFSASPLQWPAPRRISAQQFVDYGYEDELVLLTRLRAPASAKGNADLVANVKWAVCREVCISDRAQLTLSVPVVRKAEVGPARALFQRTRANIPKPLPADWRTSAFSSADSFVLTLRTVSSGSPVDPGAETSFFPQEKQQIENAAPQKVLRNANAIQFILKKSEQLAKEPETLKGVVSFGPGRSFLVTASVEPK